MPFRPSGRGGHPARPTTAAIVQDELRRLADTNLVPRVLDDLDQHFHFAQARLQ